MRSVLTLAVLAAAALTAAAADWPTWHGNAALDGVAPGALEAPLRVVGKARIGGEVSGGPVVVGGTAFVATVNGIVAAVGSDGKVLWSRTFERPDADGKPARESFLAPPAWHEGRLVVATANGVVMALDAVTGTNLWRYAAGDRIQGSPGLLPGGRIAVLVQSDGTLHTLDAAAGQVVWKASPAGRSDGGPSAAGGRVVFGACDAALHVVDAATGEPLKKVAFGEGSEVAGGVALAGVMAFAGSRLGGLHAVDLEKSAVVWSQGAGSGEMFTTPAVASHEVVYVDGNGVVFAADRADGATRWQHATKAVEVESPVIAGNVVVVCADGALKLLGLLKGTELWSEELGDDLSSPAVADGRVYVAADDGQLVILEGDKGGARHD
jgi:outer membrane protein assembly factor BamB